MNSARKIEFLAPDLARELESTLATHSAQSCAAALHSAAGLYNKLRRQLADGNVSRRLSAEKAAMDFLGEVEARCGLEIR